MMKRRTSLWWHLAAAAAAVLLYLATRVPLARAPGILDVVALPEIAQWSTRAARWVLLGALGLAACGRGAAALACGGVALGLIGSVLAEWGRDAADLLEMQREADPAFAGKSLADLVQAAPGAWVLGAGALLWLGCVALRAARPRGGAGWPDCGTGSPKRP